MQMFTVALFFLCVVQSMAELPACDKDLEAKIEKLWKTNGKPRNILATLNRKGKGTLLYSTEVVPLKDLPVDSPKCVNGEFTPTSTKFTVVPQSGTLEASKASVSHDATEKDGAVFEDKGAIKKIIVSNKYGVTSFVSCNPNGGSGGPIAAGVAVANKKYKDSESAIEAAKAELSGLGIKLTTDYTKNCV